MSHTSRKISNQRIEQHFNTPTRIMVQFAFLLSTLLLITPVSLAQRQFIDKSAQFESIPNFIRFKHLLTEADDVSVGSVLSIFQDDIGLMWIGGRAGLARYDGYNFATYIHDVNDPGSLGGNTINDITQDNNGNLWIATQAGLEKYDYDTDKFTHYRHKSEDPNSLVDNLIMGLFVDSKGTLWLNTKGGLNRYNPEDDNFTRFPRNESEALLAGEYVLDMDEDFEGNYYLATGYGFKKWNPETGEIRVYTAEGDNPWNMPHTLCRSVHVDSQGRVWTGTEKGLARFYPDAEKFVFYPTELDPPGAKSGDSTWDVIEDSRGVIWVTTDGQGLNYLNPGSDKLKTSLYRPNDPDSLSSNVVRVVFENSHGDIWAGNYPSGVNIFERYGSEFRTQRKTSDGDDSLSVGNVRSIYEDENGDLWLATDAGGLNFFDSKTLKYTHYRHDPEDTNSMGSDDVMWVMEDDAGWLWTATWSSGINKYNPKTGQFVRYGGDLGVPNSSLTTHTWAIHQGQASGIIWIANLGGGVARYWPETDSFTFLLHEKGEGTLPDGQVWVAIEDKEGYLWVGTRKGLGRKNPHDDVFTNFVHDNTDLKSLKNDNILSLFIDSKNRLWIGTQGGGLNLYHPETESFSSIGSREGLISDVIRSIIEDEDGNIWVGTDKGLSNYNPETKVVKNYDKHNGLQGNNFNIGAAFKARNGDLIFGGVEGFSRFNPKAVVPNSFLPPIVFTNFLISNKEVPIGGKDPVIEKSILKADKVKLNYWQNIFSINYSGLSYRIPERNQYAYMLEGFDTDWHYVNNERKATYTNLDAGEYTFMVKAANNEGMWSDEIKSIKVYVAAPPWKTWWAYTLYVLAIVSVITWYVITNKRKLALERSVVQRLKSLDKHKDEYLANTSHELRTPLFGIIGLAEGLIESLQNIVSKMDLNNLTMIVESGKRLSTIVEDVLDFSNIQNQTLKINKKAVDISVITKFITLMCQPLVSVNKIKIVSKIPPDFTPIIADEDRLQQILHNLIGNAIKFTEHGSVTIDAVEKDNEIIVSIADTGIGIPKEDHEKLFDSYTQLDEASTRSRGGTGLGLAITKRLIELHDGKIWLESEVGKGSTFYFSLPKGNVTRAEIETFKLSDKVADKIRVSGYSSDTMLNTEDPQRFNTKENQPLKVEVQSIANKKIQQKNQHFRILVADDEPVNRRVIRNHLASYHYQVIEAINGNEALKIINEEQNIDLLILDVMMPLMSGYEVCHEIRKYHSKLNLPIIFITAKFQEEDIFHGFKRGANDFLSKPISRTELLSRVELHLQLLEAGRDMEKKISERTEDLKIANSKLKELSQSDPLTGLKNRRFLEDSIEADIQKVVTNYENFNIAKDSNSDLDYYQDSGGIGKSDITFFLVDIDHFKLINDTYGHAIGDEVIVEMANRLKSAARDSDYVVRWGGEEFIIVTRSMKRSEAPDMAERIRLQVEQTSFNTSDSKDIKVTCSLGFASFPLCPESPRVYSWTSVVDVADMGLYAAKLSGRNGWVGIPKAISNIQLDTDINVLAKRNEIDVVSSFNKITSLDSNINKNTG